MEVIIFDRLIVKHEPIITTKNGELLNVNDYPNLSCEAIVDNGTIKMNCVYNGTESLELDSVEKLTEVARFYNTLLTRLNLEIPGLPVEEVSTNNQTE